MKPATEVRRCRTAILISGSGSNLQAFIKQVADGRLPLDIALVVSNRSDAYGLLRAAAASIPTLVISHRDFASRDAFDMALAAELDAAAIELIILAGFMRILSAAFVQHFAGRIMNVHPALLPLYPGLDTHARALDAGDRQHGSTVHFVTEELDGGPRIIAGRIAVRREDTVASLKSRVQAVEHQIYPQAAAWYAEQRLSYRNGEALLDGQLLNEPVVRDFD
ncbi:MAG TPA: phosphoribosylglycinamide formyltransferase [Woeseiaceae bacterium]|nr:phosphoribosylglycinamide formyltransferase [Woeseiaceae bacterium]